MGAIMNLPSPFEVSRLIGNNLAGAFEKRRDENTIESVLAEVAKSQNPEQIQQSIGKILSQVSPERRGDAVKYLQNTYERIQEKNNTLKQQKTLSDLGIPENTPPALYGEVYKQNAKNKRLENVYGQQNKSNGNIPIQTNINNQQEKPLIEQNGMFDWSKVPDQELIKLTGHTDKEISEPAKAELKRKDEERKIQQKSDEFRRKTNSELTKDAFLQANEIASTLPLKQSSLGLMNEAIINKDMSFFSLDNLAEISGIEGLRSPQGAIFKTAGKEFLLGNIRRAGARPNMWIEKQIADMMAKVGRSTAANLSVTRALNNELNLDDERVRYTFELADQYEKDGKDIPRDFSYKISQHMSKYAEETQLELFNDLRAYKSIEDGKPEKFREVKKGTKISKVVAQSLLNKYDNDPKKAREEAQRLGYRFNE